MGGRTILVGMPMDTDGKPPIPTSRDLRFLACGVVIGMLLILAILAVF